MDTELLTYELSHRSEQAADPARAGAALARAGRGSGAARAVKLAKRMLLHALKALGVFHLTRMMTRADVRILCYHSAWRGEDGFPGDSMFILPETFAARLAMIRRLGFPVITLDEAVEGLAGRRPLPPAPVVITIDDGWFGTCAHLAPELHRQGMPATLYCDTESLLAGLPLAHVMVRYLRRIHCADKTLSPEAEAAYRRALDMGSDSSRESRLEAAHTFAACAGIDLEPYLQRRVFAYMNADELRETQALGLSVQLHAHRHSLHQFSPQEIEDEIRLNRDALSALLDQPPSTFRHFCYPSGITATAATKPLRALGISSATTLVDGLAGVDDLPLLLPRVLDGDHLSAIEFEAELCGIGTLLRALHPRLHRAAPEPSVAVHKPKMAG